MSRSQAMESHGNSENIRRLYTLSYEMTSIIV